MEEYLVSIHNQVRTTSTATVVSHLYSYQLNISERCFDVQGASKWSITKIIRFAMIFLRLMFTISVSTDLWHHMGSIIFCQIVSEELLRHCSWISFCQLYSSCQLCKNNYGKLHFIMSSDYHASRWDIHRYSVSELDQSGIFTNILSF